MGEPAKVAQVGANQAPVVPIKKDWMNMSKAEREADKSAKLQKAVTAVKAGALSGIQVKVGDHTLTLRPTGMSEKGSVAYGYMPTVIQFGDKKLRINKISFSILNDGDTGQGGIDWDNLNT